MDLPSNNTRLGYWMLGAIPVVVVALAFALTARDAAVGLAAIAAAGAVVRLVAPERPGSALVVRRKAVDVSILAFLALSIGVIALGGTPGL